MNHYPMTEDEEHLELLLRLNGPIMVRTSRGPVPVEMKVGHYANGRIAIYGVCCEEARDEFGGVFSVRGDRYGNVTMNIPSEPLGAHEIIVTQEEGGIASAFTEAVREHFPDVFTETDRTVQQGDFVGMVWRIAPFDQWRSHLADVQPSAQPTKDPNDGEEEPEL